MKRIVLLGARGQLGSDLVRVLAGEAVTLTTLNRCDVDVREPESVRARLATCPFDVLINCTSYHQTDEVETHATEAFAVNAHAVAGLAEICAAANACFVHVSTDYVFDGSRTRPYRETDGVGPINVYGASKAMGERLAFLANPQTIVFRVASLFGAAGSRGKGGNFVETMIRVGTERGLLRVVEDQTMSPTATSDVAWMMARAIEKEIDPGIYHAVNSGSASWYEFACAIVAGAGVDARVEPIGSADFPTVARRPRYSVLDNGKLAAAVGAIDAWPNALTRYLALRAKGRDARAEEAAQTRG